MISADRSASGDREQPQLDDKQLRAVAIHEAQQTVELPRLGRQRCIAVQRQYKICRGGQGEQHTDRDEQHIKRIGSLSAARHRSIAPELDPVLSPLCPRPL